MPTGIQFAHERYVPPLAADFPTIIGTNSELPTLTDSAASVNVSGLHMNFGNNPAVAQNVRMALRAKTAGAGQSIIVRIRPHIFNHTFMGAGIVLREASTDKLVTWGIFGNTGGVVNLSALRWTAPARGATQIGTAYNTPTDFEWFRITCVADDPKKFSVSRNGINWHQLFADASQTAYFTFDQVGLFLYSDNAGVGVNGDANTSKIMMNCLYFSDAGIVPTV